MKQLPSHQSITISSENEGKPQILVHLSFKKDPVLKFSIQNNNNNNNNTKINK